ncbi:hypothetical protein SY91_05874 [Burkholderia cenocepacia]|nr:hypothetical protein SY91_05874 [Burkholderia cenocepacia]
MTLRGFPGSLIQDDTYQRITRQTSSFGIHR